MFPSQRVVRVSVGAGTGAPPGGAATAAIPSRLAPEVASLGQGAPPPPAPTPALMDGKLFSSHLA